MSLATIELKDTRIVVRKMVLLLKEDLWKVERILKWKKTELKVEQPPVNKSYPSCYLQVKVVHSLTYALIT